MNNVLFDASRQLRQLTRLGISMSNVTCGDTSQLRQHA